MVLPGLRLFPITETHMRRILFTPEGSLHVVS
jgi:hypothetical protein